MAQTPQSLPGGSFSDLSGGAVGAVPMDSTVPGGATFSTPPPTDSTASAFGGFGSAFAPGAFGAGGGATTAIADNVGYIDSAIIRSRVRVRFDANYDDTSPDKAEFFYAKCGCFGNFPFLKQDVVGLIHVRPEGPGPQHPPGT